MNSLFISNLKKMVVFYIFAGKTRTLCFFFLQKNWNFVQQEGLQKAHVPTTEEHMSTEPNCVIV
jgi:hypothetical protein